MCVCVCASLCVCVCGITVLPVTDDLCFGSAFFSGGQQGYCQTSEKETSFQGNRHLFLHLLALLAHVACGSFFFFFCQITVRFWHLLFFWKRNAVLVAGICSRAVARACSPGPCLLCLFDYYGLLSRSLAAGKATLYEWSSYLLRLQRDAHIGRKHVFCTVPAQLWEATMLSSSASDVHLYRCRAAEIVLDRHIWKCAFNIHMCLSAVI